MRLFEALILACLIIFILLKGRQGASRVASYLPLLLGSFLVLHLLIEKPRWQMNSLYLFSALIISLTLAMLFTKRDLLRWLARPRWRILFGVVIVIEGTLPILVPIPQLTQPGGPYAVGTTTFEWVDVSRDEIYTPEEDHRRLAVQVWYPAEPEPGAQRAPYHPNIDPLLPALADFIRIPEFTLSHLRMMRTNSYPNAPVAAGSDRFPVVVFSHGWNGMRIQNTFQVEELASRGYVVMAADHSYGASAAVFPNGDSIRNLPEALPDDVPEEEYQQAARQLGQSWAGDIRFLLDQAARMDAGEISSPLASRIDLNRTGVFGHSTGGGATVEACYLDSRCRAGLAMDAWMIPYDRQISAEGLAVPFMFMESESWNARGNAPLVNALYANMRADAYRIEFSGVNHTGFSDFPGFMPIIFNLQSGTLFATTPQEKMVSYTVAFFDRYLKSENPSLLLPSAAPLKGVRFETKAGNP